MIDERDHGDSSFASAPPPFVETCLRLAHVAVRECFWRVWDRIAWKRLEASLEADGYKVCPVCEAGEERDTCKICEGFGCVTFEQHAAHEKLIEAIMSGEVAAHGWPPPGEP